MFYEPGLQRVGKYWNREIEDPSNLSFEASQILMLKQKIVTEVKNGKWTEEEYQNFKMEVGKMLISKFVMTLPIINCFLDLSLSDCQKEINHLVQEELLQVELEKPSLLGILEACNTLFSKVSYFSRLPIYEIEKEVNVSTAEKIKAYESIILEMKSSNQYLLLLQNAFQEWVEEVVINSSLQDVLKSYSEEILKTKEKDIYAVLRKLNYQQGKQKESEILSYKKDSRTRYIKRKE